MCTILGMEPWSQQLLLCFTMTSLRRLDVILHRDALCRFFPLHAHFWFSETKVVFSDDNLNNVAINSLLHELKNMRLQAACATYSLIKEG